MPGPFEDYVTNRDIPGSSDDSPAYFMRESLQPAGWSPEATDWAIRNVPMGYTPETLNNDSEVMGYYDRPGGYAVTQIGTQHPAAEVSDTTRHELQHAWDRQQTGYFPTGAETQAAFGDQLDPGISGQLGNIIDKDPTHATNDLYEVFGRQGISTMAPDFLKKYFSNMTFNAV